MQYTRLRQAVVLQHAISKYNRKYGSQLRLQHIRVLFILSTKKTPIKRSEILFTLHKWNLTMNYHQMDRVIGYLQDYMLLWEYKKKAPSEYLLAPAGIELLGKLEAMVRKARLDRIKQ